MRSLLRPLALLAFALALPVSAFAQEASGPTGTLGTCLQAASAIKTPAGGDDFTKVEYLDPSADGTPTFEIELTAEDGTEWEFMCDATTGRIYEIEQEAASASDARFSRGAEVSEDDARQAVTQLYPGTIGEVEYEIESSGAASYEIDVLSGGTEWKVEVDAATGAIIEVHVERWEIGVERDERP
jgi:uncharacterized membrane protein YkoI